MIKDKVVSLELAKRMAQLGWDYETERYWEYHYKDIDNGQSITELITSKQLNSRTYVGPYYCASDSIEILKRLPKAMCEDDWDLMICWELECICNIYYNNIHTNIIEAETKDEKLPEALGRMWCYLKEKGLL